MKKEYYGRCGALVIWIVVATTGLTTAAVAAPGEPGMTNRIIVKYQDSLTTADAQNQLSASMRTDRSRQLSQRTGVELSYHRRTASGADVFLLQKWMREQDVEAMAAKLAASPEVEYAEPDRMLQPLLTPNDPRFNEQWHYFEATGGLNVTGVWDTYTGSGVVVAVIDTGYRPHADLLANIVGGYDFISDTFVANDGNGRDSNAQDPGDWTDAGVCGGGQPPSFRSSSWHGTHVAGTIAAVTNNSAGVSGVAFGAKVLPVRVLGKCGGFTSDIADGMIWASGGSVSGVPANANPAKVLNLSLGGGGSCGTTQQNAINTARANGATVVVAAGNSNINASNATPANCSGVVTVAATDRSGGKAFYSNFGSVVDLAAPGGETSPSSVNGVLSTLNTGTTTPGSDTFAFYQGTSMATPHVAGLAALMYEADPTITPDQVETALKNSARSFPASCSQCGAGIADAAAAIAEVTGGGPGDTVLENGIPETGLSGGQGSELRFTLEVPAGASNLSFQISGSSGDADLYVRFGSPPTTGTWDCRPYLNGSNETCSIANAQEGTYHVLLQGFSSYSGVTLVGSYNESTGGGETFTVENLSANRGQWNRFTLDVPSGMSNLTVTISGGSGDADLYLRFGAAPSTGSWDCRPYRNGNAETCSVSGPQAGTWHIGIRAFRTYSGVTLAGSYSP